MSVFGLGVAVQIVDSGSSERLSGGAHVEISGLRAPIEKIPGSRTLA